MLESIIGVIVFAGIAYGAYVFISRKKAAKEIKNAGSGGGRQGPPQKRK